MVLRDREQFNYNLKIFNKIMPDIELNDLVCNPQAEEEKKEELAKKLADISGLSSTADKYIQERNDVSRNLDTLKDKDNELLKESLPKENDLKNAIKDRKINSLKICYLRNSEKIPLKVQQLIIELKEDELKLDLLKKPSSIIISGLCSKATLI